MIVLPSLLILFINFQKSCLSSTSMAAVGSSKIKIFGSWTRDLANSNLRFIPPDSARVFFFLCFSRPKSLSINSTLSFIFSLFSP